MDCSCPEKPPKSIVRAYFPVYVYVYDHKYLHVVDQLCCLLVWFRHTCCTFYRPCEVETHLGEELPDDEPEDGDVLDESILDDMEDDIDTDEDDQDVQV